MALFSLKGRSSLQCRQRTLAAAVLLFMALCLSGPFGLLAMAEVPVVTPAPVHTAPAPVTAMPGLPLNPSGVITPGSGPLSVPVDPVTLDPLFSFATQGITLSEAFQQAEQHNLQLQAAQKDNLMAGLDVRIARQYANPQLTLNGSWGKVVTHQSNPQMVALSQDIETAGKHRLKVEIAQSEQALTRFQVDQMRWDIRNQVRQAYAGLVAAEQSLDNLEIQRSLLERLVEIANKRYQAGAAAYSEVLQAELARNQLTAQKNQFLARTEQATYTLNSLLGNQRPPYFEPAEKGVLKIRIQKTELAPDLNFSMPSPATLYAKALLVRPDLKASAQLKEIAARQLKLTRRQRIPDMNLMAGWLFAPNPRLPDGNVVWLHGAFVQTMFDLPVYHNQKWEIQRAQTRLQQTELEVLDTQRQAQLEIDRACSQLLASRKNIELYELNLIPQARTSLQLAQKSYEVGKTSLANVVLAQQATQNVLSNYLDVVVEYQNAWGELERSVGVPAEQW